MRPLLHGNYFDDVLIVVIVLLFAGIFWYVLIKVSGDEAPHPPDEPHPED